MTTSSTTDNHDPVTPETVAEIEIAANALKGVKEACNLTDAKPEFVYYLFKCSPAAVSALCYTLRAAWRWKREATALLERYDAVAETFGGEVGSSKVANLERGVADLRARIKKQDAVISAYKNQDEDATAALREQLNNAADLEMLMRDEISGLRQQLAQVTSERDEALIRVKELSDEADVKKGYL